MAKINGNLFVSYAKGMVGNQLVYRVINGETILSKRPDSSKDRTSAQNKHAIRFKEATIYAKAALADQNIGKIYKEKALKSGNKISAYNAAIADFLIAPVISNINLDAYSGQQDEKIVITATDNYGVEEVLVEIHQSDNSLVEKGLALPKPNGLDWEYTTTVVNTQLTGSTVTVRVSDIPGNVTVMEQII